MSYLRTLLEEMPFAVKINARIKFSWKTLNNDLWMQSIPEKILLQRQYRHRKYRIADQLRRKLQNLADQCKDKKYIVQRQLP